MANWNDVISNPAFKEETPEAQAAIREDFFNKVIAPQVQKSGDDVEEVRKDFYKNAGLEAAPIDTTDESLNQLTPAEILKKQGVSTRPNYNQAAQGASAYASPSEKIDVQSATEQRAAERGISEEDAYRSLAADAVEVVASTGAGLATGGLGASASFLPRMGIQAATSAAGDTAAGMLGNAIAGRDLTEESVEDAALGAVFGAGGEAVGGLFGKGANLVTGNLNQASRKKAANVAAEMLDTQAAIDKAAAAQVQAQSYDAAARVLDSSNADRALAKMTPAEQEKALSGLAELEKFKGAEDGLDLSSAEARKEASAFLKGRSVAAEEEYYKVFSPSSNLDLNAIRLARVMGDEAGAFSDMATDLAFSSPAFKKQMGMNMLERGLLTGGRALENRLPIVPEMRYKAFNEKRKVLNAEIVDAVDRVSDANKLESIMSPKQEELLKDYRARVTGRGGNTDAIQGEEFKEYQQLFGISPELDKALIDSYSLGKYAAPKNAGEGGNMGLAAGALSAYLAPTATLAAVKTTAPVMAARELTNVKYKAILKQGKELADTVKAQGKTTKGKKMTSREKAALKEEMLGMIKGADYEALADQFSELLSVLARKGITLDEE